MLVPSTSDVNISGSQSLPNPVRRPRTSLSDGIPRFRDLLLEAPRKSTSVFPSKAIPETGHGRMRHSHMPVTARMNAVCRTSWRGPSHRVVPSCRRVTSLERDPGMRTIGHPREACSLRPLRGGLRRSKLPATASEQVARGGPAQARGASRRRPVGQAGAPSWRTEQHSRSTA